MKKIDHNQIIRRLEKKFPTHTFCFVPYDTDSLELLVDDFMSSWVIPIENDGRFSFFSSNPENWIYRIIVNGMPWYLKTIQKEIKKTKRKLGIK